MTIHIHPIEKDDLPAIAAHVRDFWGNTTLVAHGDVFQIQDLEGLKAILDGSIVGFLHYQIRGEECEILTLASLREGIGVGTSLIESVEKIARNNHCHLLCLITTNDNLHALGFYQRRGFHLTALFEGQIELSRKLKPSIPTLGMDNIPIRDELRLEKILS